MCCAKLPHSSAWTSTAGETGSGSKMGSTASGVVGLHQGQTQAIRSQGRGAALTTISDTVVPYKPMLALDRWVMLGRVCADVWLTLGQPGSARNPFVADTIIV